MLLPLGLDGDLAERLVACSPPDGGAVDFITDTFCGFGGHQAPGQKEEKEESEGWGPLKGGRFVAFRPLTWNNMEEHRIRKLLGM